jgi:hypothetical protein
MKQPNQAKKVITQSPTRTLDTLLAETSKQHPLFTCRDN